MGMNPQGKLYYGYTLGCDDTGWEFEETGEYGRPALPWLDDGDFVDGAERAIKADGVPWVGHFYGDPAPIGVGIVRHGHLDSTVYTLTTFAQGVEWGETEPVDFAALEARRVAEDWDGLLARAVAALGITPKRDKPYFLLAARYG